MKAEVTKREIVITLTLNEAEATALRNLCGAVDLKDVQRLGKDKAEYDAALEVYDALGEALRLSINLAIPVRICYA